MGYTVLVNGNNLYSIISQHVKKDFLLLTEVPEMVSIDNNTFYLEYSESFSGALLLDDNNDPYVTLEHSFNQLFDIGNYKTCLPTIGAYTFAVFMPFPDVFKIFYSHSLNIHGNPCESGYSILISVEGVQNLVNYFSLFRSSHNQNFGSPFEMKGVRCQRNNDLSSNLLTTSIIKSACNKILRVRYHQDKIRNLNFQNRTITK